MVNFAGLLLLLHVWTQMQKKEEKKNAVMCVD